MTKQIKQALAGGICHRCGSISTTRERVGDGFRGYCLYHYETKDKTDELVKFTIGGQALTVAGLDFDDDDGAWAQAFARCRFVRRFGPHGRQYEGKRSDVEIVLQAIEGCPAYAPPGQYDGAAEGFGGEYVEITAVRRASDSIRKALGMRLLGYRRSGGRRRRKAVK